MTTTTHMTRHRSGTLDSAARAPHSALRPAAVKRDLQSIWKSVCRRIAPRLRHLQPPRRLTTKHQGSAFTCVTLSTPCLLRAWAFASRKWFDFGQVSLAVIARHAGWKLRSLPRPRLLNPLQLISSLFGLPHFLSYSSKSSHQL